MFNLSFANYDKYPSIIGIMCVTPSPESITNPVSRPYQNSDNTDYAQIFIPLKP